MIIFIESFLLRVTTPTKRITGTDLDSSENHKPYDFGWHDGACG